MDYVSKCVMVGVLSWYILQINFKISYIGSLLTVMQKKCIMKGKYKQLGCKISPELANEHTNNYPSHQIIEQKKIRIYVDGTPGLGLGQAQTIWICKAV